MVCDMRNSEKPAVRGGEHNAENQQDWAETILPLSLESLPSTDHQQKEEYFARYASSSTLTSVSLPPSLFLVIGRNK